MNLRRKIILVLSGAAIPFLVFGANLLGKNKKPTIKYPARHVVLQGDPILVKPWHRLSSFLPGATFNRAVFKQLLYFDRDYDIKPGLFISWNWDEPTSSYTFDIDDSLQFDSTRKLSPKDIEFALLKSFISNSVDSTQSFLRLIKGVGKLKKGMPFKSGMCPGIEIISENKMRIILNKKSHLFLYSLGDLLPPIAPVEDFGEDMYEFKSIPRGLGPYSVSWSDDNTTLIRLERKKVNKKVLDETSYPLSIDFYSHGDALINKADIAIGAGGNKVRKLADKFSTVYSPVPAGIGVLDFNYNNKLGSNKLFREAVSLSLDREKIFSGQMSSKVSFELIPNKYYGRANTKMEFSPQKAKKIVQKHFKKTFEDKRFKVIYHSSDGGEMPPYMKLIKRQLDDVGIFLDYVGRADITFSKKDVQFVMSSYGLVTSFIDPVTPFGRYLEDSNLTFHSQKNDVDARELYMKVLDANSLEKRSSYLSQLSKYFQSEFRQIPLSEIYPSFVFRKSKVSKLDPKDIFFTIDFDKVYLK